MPRFDYAKDKEDDKMDEVFDVEAAALAQLAEERAARRKELAAKRDTIKAEELAIAKQLEALEDGGGAVAPIVAATPGAAKPLPEIKFGTTEADTKGAVTLKVLFKRCFKTRANQAACSLSLVDANGKYCRITFVGEPPPAGCDEGSYVEINGTVKAPSKYCASGFACEVQPKTATIKAVQPTDEVRLKFPQDGALPALTSGAQLSAVATVSAANGFE